MLDAKFGNNVTYWRILYCNVNFTWTNYQIIYNERNYFSQENKQIVFTIGLAIVRWLNLAPLNVLIWGYL